jgi:outer membrane murein-binding lipoprotein Lpp
MDAFVKMFLVKKRKETMMNATKLTVILLSAGLTVGCASKSDFDALKTRVDGIDAKLTSVEATANDAKEEAAAARAAAERTEAAVNAKLDRGFKKGVMK